MAAIRGVRRSLVRAVTTDPNAAPITTPTARSTTLPRKINCLKPDSMTIPPLAGMADNVNAQWPPVKAHLTGPPPGNGLEKVQRLALAQPRAI